jgi:serine protease Do
MWREGINVRRSVAVIALIITLGIGGIAGVWAFGRSNSTVFGAPKVPFAVAADHAINVGPFINGFASVVKPALPAVVNISSSKIVKAQNGMQNSPMFNDPFFRQFFGDQSGDGPQPRNQRERSLGSGVIVSQDGYVLTNNHVVDGASEIRVSLSDKREFQAKVIGTDPKTDVAVLKINAEGLPTMPLGDSSKSQIGDVVLAIGDPFGIGETVTMGIISATGRSVPGMEPGGYQDFIQTDASINPGNSGGALINVSGNLIGINTAILTGGGGGNQGIGFAIPIDLARNVMEQILQHGHVVRGYLGVNIQNVTPELAKAFGIKENRGALVADISPDTPAAKAGIQKGDVILGLNGQPVEDINQLTMHITQMAPGSTAHLQVLRNGETRDMSVTLGQLPEKNGRTEKLGSNKGSSSALEGVQVETLTSDVARQLELPASTKGVVITGVDPSSAAADSGLRRGDVIQEVNRHQVANQGQFEEAFSGAKGQQVLLLVNRGGTTLYLVIGGGSQ